MLDTVETGRKSSASKAQGRRENKHFIMFSEREVTKRTHRKIMQCWTIWRR